ncbi:MAG: hypothetical protein A3F70_18015 [Acidobacteria bacterium RIFCSPLOWO2_12_FULL_67_14]|nr:MAG: hypothetical protein A3H29_05460 [Acidobacteria bacterium RIFCSPLOWO2_02_FULL_67_21]OFW41188.1 MAG: hypothetical protein A3F70_18015 [Acidobacteria bacterium RIFCSPLOWO2_12_FULL_67_14]
MKTLIRCVVAVIAFVAPVTAAQQAGKPTPPRRVTTDHLQIATYASHDAVAPGEPFSIVFDIRPRERMHVYAPGADGYRIITVALARNPVLVTQPLQYPASEIYFFEPLNERVPVFQKPFRLTQPLAVSAAPAQRDAVAALDAVTIKGTLEYQACDDRICFAPTSVPVSYTIRIRPPDAARAGGA